MLLEFYFHFPELEENPEYLKMISDAGNTVQKRSSSGSDKSRKGSSSRSPQTSYSSQQEDEDQMLETLFTNGHLQGLTKAAKVHPQDLHKLLTAASKRMKNS